MRIGSEIWPASCSPIHAVRIFCSGTVKLSVLAEEPLPLSRAVSVSVTSVDTESRSEEIVSISRSSKSEGKKKIQRISSETTSGLRLPQ